MAETLTAADQLQREFLGIRCRLIDIAASLDRIDRAEDGPIDDPRLTQIREACALLVSVQGDRAETVQLHFSLPHDEKTEA